MVITMNKRQKKKNRTYKRKKVRAIIDIDLTNVTENSIIDIYVSKRFEDKCRKGFITIPKALVATGKDNIAYIHDGFDKKIYIRHMKLSNTDKSYYVIYSGDGNE